MDELFSWRTFGEIVGAVFLLWLGSRLRRGESKEERKAAAKREARLKITKWAEECLQHFDEINIKIYGTDYPMIKSLDIFSDLKRLEAPGKSAYSSAKILDEETQTKTKVALDKLCEVILAFRKRDNNVWREMPKVVESFSELIDCLSKKEL
jgi:hypothetical protein